MAEVNALGYVGCTITDVAAWDNYLVSIYGLEKRQDAPKGVNQYRLDDHHHRLCLIESDDDALSYIGWEVESREALSELSAHLEANGITRLRLMPKPVRVAR